MKHFIVLALLMAAITVVPVSVAFPLGHPLGDLGPQAVMEVPHGDPDEHGWDGELNNDNVAAILVISDRLAGIWFVVAPQVKEASVNVLVSIDGSNEIRSNTRTYLPYARDVPILRLSPCRAR